MTSLVRVELIMWRTRLTCVPLDLRLGLHASRVRHKTTTEPIVNQSVTFLTFAGLPMLCIGCGWWLLRQRAKSQPTEPSRSWQRLRDDLERTQEAVMLGLAHLSESRDEATGQHLERIRVFTRELAMELSKQPKFCHIITPEFVQRIEVSAMLHDIGKVGIADEILLKPGSLTPDERREMQRHPLVSSDCLSRLEQTLGASNFLQMAHEIALYHHERWDGLGYPFGLRGAAIPLAARIVAITDVYDALSSPRVYKPAFPHRQCVETIRLATGTQFDPELVAVFLQIESRIEKLSESLRVERRSGDAATSSTVTRADGPHDLIEASASQTERFVSASRVPALKK